MPRSRVKYYFVHGVLRVIPLLSKNELMEWAIARSNTVFFHLHFVLLPSNSLGISQELLTGSGDPSSTDYGRELGSQLVVSEDETLVSTRLDGVHNVFEPSERNRSRVPSRRLRPFEFTESRWSLPCCRSIRCFGGALGAACSIRALSLHHFLTPELYFCFSTGLTGRSPLSTLPPPWF